MQRIEAAHPEKSVDEPEGSWFEGERLALRALKPMAQALANVLYMPENHLNYVRSQFSRTLEIVVATLGENHNAVILARQMAKHVSEG